MTRNKLVALKKASEWNQQPGESSEDYSMFLSYLQILPPGDRNLLTAFRNYMVDNRAINRGEALTNHMKKFEAWRQTCARWDWVKRSNAYDTYMNLELLATHEKARRERIQEMTERHIEGAHILNKVALESFYVRDPETGEILYDQSGNPITRPMDSDAAAVKAFKVGVDVERTALGQPAYIATMATEQIQRRILELQMKLQLTDGDDDDEDYDDEDDTIDGEIVGGE